MNKQKPIIYLLDDDQHIYNSMRLLLANVNIELQFFQNIHTLSIAAKQYMPDCLLIELNLKPDDGLILYQSLKTLNINPPTIFLATYSDIHTTNHAIQAGAIDFIQKPYIDSRLIKSIQSTLDLYQKN